MQSKSNVAKFHENLTLQQFKVIQGPRSLSHRSWCQSKAHVRLPILVTNSNFGRICYDFSSLKSY